MFRARLSFAFVTAAVATSCAAKKPIAPPGDQKPRTGLEKRHHVLHMDPVRFVADPTGKVRVEEVDVGNEFAKAEKLYAAKEYRAALKIYDAIANETTNVANKLRAIYNAGLCFEGLKRCHDAVTRYADVTRLAPKSPESRDADVRRVVCLKTIKRWRDAADAIETVLKRSDFEAADRIELAMWRGVAFIHLRDLDEATRILRRALDKFDEHAKYERLDKAVAAETLFWLGEIYYRRFFAVLLDDPKTELNTSMLDKARALYQARDEYLRAIERGDVYWSAAAAHRIATLYEKLREHVLAIPIPRELNESQAELYVSELARHKIIEPLIGKATHAHEQVLKLAERMSFDSEHVRKSRAAIERLKRLVLKSPVAPPVKP
ncbi:MAG: hypothetical protein HYY84_08800 [Deltaproteobacteria bacterium]|nr:hypothetical protein [Deltaproteobacteria bacterium]